MSYLAYFITSVVTISVLATAVHIMWVELVPTEVRKRMLKSLWKIIGKVLDIATICSIVIILIWAFKTTITDLLGG